MAPLDGGIGLIYGISVVLLWAVGTGTDVMKRIAPPQVRGVFPAMLLTLFVIPPVYVMWRWWKERPANQASEAVCSTSGG